MRTPGPSATKLCTDRINSCICPSYPTRPTASLYSVAIVSANMLNTNTTMTTCRKNKDHIPRSPPAHTPKAATPRAPAYPLYALR